MDLRRERYTVHKRIEKEIPLEVRMNKGHVLTLEELYRELQYWQELYSTVSDDKAKHGTGEIVRMIKETIKLKKDERDGKQE